MNGLRDLTCIGSMVLRSGKGRGNKGTLSSSNYCEYRYFELPNISNSTAMIICIDPTGSMSEKIAEWTGFWGPSDLHLHLQSSPHSPTPLL